MGAMEMTTRDGTRIYFKDWGEGQPIVFCHGWPLQGDAWDAQLLYFGERGYRAIAHDRRGHGRSTQTWTGNDMNTYAGDLSDLFDELDLKNAILVGHSTGGGEVVRYLGRHGSARVQKAVLIGAVPPLMLKTPAHPGGLAREAFDKLRTNVAQNRAQLFRELSLPFYGFNRKGAAISEGLQESFFLQGMQCGIKAAYDCIKAFSETDFTEDLKKIDVPVLLVHGDDDQIVPINISAQLSVRLLKNATLKVYKGAPHGLAQTRPDELNGDILAFIK
jgi:non-heme chloroperoxidase